MDRWRRRWVFGNMRSLNSLKPSQISVNQMCVVCTKIFWWTYTVYNAILPQLKQSNTSTLGGETFLAIHQQTNPINRVYKKTILFYFQEICKSSQKQFMLKWFISKVSWPLFNNWYLNFLSLFNNWNLKFLSRSFYLTVKE